MKKTDTTEAEAARPVRQERVLSDGTRVWLHARARLPTAHGLFEVVAFGNTRDGAENIALVAGRVDPATVTPVRLHSECLTGDVLASIRCDCRAQLQTAQQQIGRAGHGILLYMRQEGRGIGLNNKIAAYALQDGGMDTVEANIHLGFDDDMRTYDVAGAILDMLGVGPVSLYTNNPRKVFGLKAQGIEVVERIQLKVGETTENSRYLATKRDKSGHLI